MPLALPVQNHDLTASDLYQLEDRKLSLKIATAMYHACQIELKMKIL
jgi:hypothetical protein